MKRFWRAEHGTDVLTFQHVEMFSKRGQVQERLFTISKDLPTKTNVNEHFGDQNT